MKKAGDELENRVVALYKGLGKWNVKKDIRLHDRLGNLSQIDVRYGLFRKTYIECKNYSGHPVGLEDVAKFKEVLKLNGISPSQGIFITTSWYVPRARTIGIETIDGAQLFQLEQRVPILNMMRYIRNGVVGTSLIGLIFWKRYAILDEMVAMGSLQYWTNLPSNIQQKAKKYYTELQRYLK
eukprot:TRINITY_DN10634_c0_g1_i1.p1 TRINITY_DN10634_c0_g1~~TRINITY_DN10634_c0_g1_i1.p1  ORF type:complete len:211 (-),score=46.26 TRINITY_DN10634_c0_g1_i1:135-680(-)